MPSGRRLGPPALLGLLLVGSCQFEYDGRLIWPESDVMGTRLLMIAEPRAPLQILEVQVENSVAFELGEDAEMLALDYHCADPVALGFRSVGGGRFEAPEGPLRGPDRVFQLQGTEALALVEISPDALPAIFREALPELRPSSTCRLFEELPVDLRIMDPLNSRFSLRLPDGSVLVVVSDSPLTGLATAHRFRAPDEVEVIELPAGVPHEQGLIDAKGQMWLYSRSGTLMRGSPDELATADETWAQFPNAPAPARCGVPGAGTSEHTTFAVWTDTGTSAEVLTVDGSGRVLHFRDGEWTVIADPIAEGRTEYLCNLSRIDVAWLEAGRAVIINGALGGGRWPITRLELAAGEAPRLVDDGLPPTESAVSKFLVSPTQGLLVGGSNGYLARRQGERWETLEPPAAFVGPLQFFREGPAGSLLLGNTTHGLAQYWPSAPDGAMACREFVPKNTLRDVRVLGEDILVGLPNNQGVTREVEAWRFRSAGVCELPAQ